MIISKNFTGHHHLYSVEVDSSIVSEVAMCLGNYLLVESYQSVYCPFSERERERERERL